MSETEKYQVLARKYRPETFDDLVGQGAMVQTLQNAFAADRIAQAFIMTGIRGTGKTTTARIIAKGMNCIGPDGTGGPTTAPCGTCEHCTAIMAGRHVDVIEMDAASRTGVGDIREIIDSVAYRAASARYKIYIIDEVHMLSTNAFNALLKTLEEPPAHVKFIFATTEIRKVPVTVLSRCQRFDLRRIEPEDMIALLKKTATSEGAAISDEALGLITRAAEGSARDAQSLLDQAISHGSGEPSADQVRAMLGLADRARVMDLFEHILKGQVGDALNELAAQYADGADPVVVLRDLAEITHWISLIKISPAAAEDPSTTPDARSRGQGLAEKLPMRILTRMWQMLLTALEEVSRAPNAMMAAEMAIIRLTHVSDLPTPEDLIKKLKDTPQPAAPPAPASGGPAPSANASNASLTPPTTTAAYTGQTATTPALQPDEDMIQGFDRFEDVLALINRHRDAQLSIDVADGVKLVSYAPGRIEFEPDENAPADLAQRLGSRLQSWTGHRWGISIANSGGAPTITDTKNAAQNALHTEAQDHPMVRAVFAHFTGAKITNVKSKADIAAEVQTEALPKIDDDWDPFDE